MTINQSINQSVIYGVKWHCAVDIIGAKESADIKKTQSRAGVRGA
jgi:hypothetical protein